MTFFFSQNFSFCRPKFLMTFFLVIDLVFRIFSFFSQILCILTMLNVVYDPFLTRKTTSSKRKFLYDTFFYSVHTFARIRHTAYQNIGGTDAWAVPPSQILGAVPPRPLPLGI